jgi:hypothetical protein
MGNSYSRSDNAYIEKRKEKSDMKTRRNRRLHFILAVMVLVGAMIACGGEASPTEAPASSEAGGSSGAATSEFIVVNQSSYEICWVYLSSADTDKWGPDQLRDDTIPAGGRYTLRGIPPGVYDVSFNACDQSVESLDDYGIDLTTNFEYTLIDD